MVQSGPDDETDRDADGSRDGDGTGSGAGESVEPTDADASTDEHEWEFGLDEVGPDGVVEAEPEPLEPGRPAAENVFFVLVGIAGTLLLLSTVI